MSIAAFTWTIRLNGACIYCKKEKNSAENYTKAKDHPRLKHTEHQICQPEY